MIDWNDLQPFLALLREGSTHAAARALGVDQSTVARRIARIEDRLGLVLFRRDGLGYHPTEAALGLRAAAEAVDSAAGEFLKQAQSRAMDQRRRLRLTCPGPLVQRLGASAFLRGLTEGPGALSVEILIEDSYSDLMAGAADVALRSGEAEDPRLVGRKVALSTWSAYAAQEFIRAKGQPASPADLARFPLIGFEGALARNRGALWIASDLAGARIAARSDSMLGVIQAAVAGLGVALLPTTIARADGRLVELLPPIEALTRGWYLLTTPDLRKTAPVARFFAHVEAHLPQLREVLMGPPAARDASPA